VTQLILPGRFSGDDAVAWFARPRLRNLYGLLAPRARVAVPDDSASRTPPFVERIWMPGYAIRLHAIAKQRDQSVWTSVDGWTGQFAIFERVEQLQELALEEDYFPPGLEETKAIEIARHYLLQYVLRVRGEVGKPVVDAVEEVRIFHFPVWVLYYRRGKAIDVRTMDGYTGKDGGPKLRISVVNALVAARDAASVPG
jgi:hypothetical protein